MDAQKQYKQPDFTTVEVASWAAATKGNKLPYRASWSSGWEVFHDQQQKEHRIISHV